MFLNSVNVFLVFSAKLDGRARLCLGPENGGTTSDTHMSKYVVEANEYLLSLYQIGHVAVIVNSLAVEASTRHEFAPTADDTVVEREIIILTI